jgi:predicted secreted protein
MATKAIFAKGTLLQSSDGAPTTPVFATIPEVKTITGPGMDSEELDVTSHDTPGYFRDFIGGLRDWGTLSFQLQYNAQEAKHVLIFNDYKDRTMREYKLIMPHQTDPAPASSATMSFTGYVKGAPLTLPFAGVITQDVEIRIVANPMPTLVPTPP